MLYIANYDHLGVILWGTEAIQSLLDRQETWLRRYPGFKVGWDNEAYTYDALKKDDPALLARMRRICRDFPGRVGMGTSTYGQPLSASIGGESNVRQLTYGVRAVEEHFGRRPPVYIMSEHAFHAQMPQLLAGAGFVGAILRTHFMMYGANPEYDLPLANWFGLDGTESIPAVPTYRGQACYCPINGFTIDPRTGENFPFGFNTLDNKVLTDYPGAFPASLEDFEALFKGRVEPLLASRADDPRQGEGIASLYQDRKDCAFVVDEEIIKVLGDPCGDITPMPEDFKARMPWGLCGNWIWQECRAAENRLIALQSAAALALDWGVERVLDEAWKALMVSEHHDIWICALEADAHAHLDASNAAMDAVQVRLEPASRWFNPLPWRREDPAAHAKGTILGIDGFGCKTADENPKATPILWDPDHLYLVTGAYELYLHPDGGFSALNVRATGEALLRPDHRSGLLAGTIDGIHRVSAGTWSAQIGEHRAVLSDRGEIAGIPYALEWTVYADHQRIDCRLTYDVDGQQIGRVGQDTRDPMLAFLHAEKLRLKFYPALSPDAHGVRDLPFAVADTDRTCIEGSLWIALQDNRRGFAILNRGAMGAIREPDGALSVPVAFSMYYVWCGAGVEYDADAAALQRERGETPPPLPRPRHFMNGRYTAQLALLPYVGTWQRAQVHRRAMEYNFPLLPVSRAAAERIDSMGLALEAEANVFLSSLYRKEGRLILRAYELEGKSGVICVSIRGKRRSVRALNLLEAPVQDWTDSAQIGAHQVLTLEIDDEEESECIRMYEAGIGRLSTTM